jgi:hypothetical protein
MSGKSIPPPPSGGSPSGASTRNLDPMPRRGEVASIGGKRDFRAPSSRRSSPMGGSASRPRVRNAGWLRFRTGGIAPTMRPSSSGAVLRSRSSGGRRAPSPVRAASRSGLRVLLQRDVRADRTSQLPSPRGTRATVYPWALRPIHRVRGSVAASRRLRSRNRATHPRSRHPQPFVVVPSLLESRATLPTFFRRAL